MFCFNCGKMIPDDSLFCEHCGARMVEEVPVPQKPRCPGCGAEVEEGALFCEACGTRLGVAPVVEEVPVVEETPAVEVPATKPCPVCGAALDEDAMFCGECGTRLGAAAAAPVEEVPVVPAVPEEPSISCPQCGTKLAVDAAFCGGCGYRLVPVVTDVTQEPVEESKKAKKAKKEKKKMSKKKKTILIILLILIPLLLGGAVAAHFLVTEHNNSTAYDAAQTLLDERKYDEAQEAFAALGDYKNAAEKVSALQKQKDEYAAAKTYLEAHQFQEAKDAFRKLGDYSDAKHWADLGVDQARADWLRSCADNQDLDNGLIQLGDPNASYASREDALIALYLETVKAYEVLGNKDADIAQCYRAIVAIEQERGQYLSALDYAANLPAEEQEQVWQAYLAQSADTALLTVLEEILPMVAQMEEEMTPYQAIEMEMDAILDAMDGKEFVEENLQQLYKEYVGLQEEVMELMDEDGYPLDYVEYYRLQARLAELQVILHENHGLMMGNGIWEERFALKPQRYYAYAAIEEMINYYLVGRAAIEDEENPGEYYMEFVNDSPYTFTLELLNEFTDGNDNLISDSGWYEIRIGAETTVRVPMILDLENEWVNWYISWNYYDVYEGNTYLD